MKKLFLLASLACFALLGTTTTASAQIKKAAIPKLWQTSPTQTWIGKDMMQYKLDKRDMQIRKSSDGIDWALVTEGVWQSKDGKFYKVADHKVMVSTDTGKSWTEAPNWTWTGYDDKAYKFDASWNLMIFKN